MSKNLQTMLRDALLNNTYDYSYMHRMLHHVWQNSYSYLYDLQKQYIGYEELHYFSNDEISRDAKRIGKLYLNKRGEACFDINYDFIHVTSDKKFYKSEFYHKEFSFLDMVNNPTIFYKIPLLVIDDQTIYDYKLKAEHSTFQIILPFGESFVISKKRNKETGDIIYLNHKIQILVLDNDGYHR